MAIWCKQAEVFGNESNLDEKKYSGEIKFGSHWPSSPLIRTCVHIQQQKTRAGEAESDFVWTDDWLNQ